MSRKAVYPTHWLNTRFPFDARARNQALEQQVLTYLEGKTWVNLTDVGAGNGANVRHLWPLIPASQAWTLIEKDPLLVEATLAERSEQAQALGYRVHRSDKEVTFTKGQQEVRIQAVETSLLTAGAEGWFAGRDLILANAVFDLFTRAQFTAFMQDILPRGIPFYTTLNYESQAFAPTILHDAEINGLYEAHMQRPQAFGEAMGATGPKQMAEGLQEMGGKVQVAPSEWEIGPKDTEMHRYLLGFMAEAIPELGLDAAQQAQLSVWLAERNAQSANHSLQIRVNHQDILAFPA
ncbi:MAG: hypothetical protein AAF399_27170 [Bacteroidota bacterium]